MNSTGGLQKSAEDAGGTTQACPNAFDNVFKVICDKHINWFLPVINSIFGTDYDEDTEISVLQPECHSGVKMRYNRSANAEIATSEITIMVEAHIYLMEYQNLNDDEITIRITECVPPVMEPSTDCNNIVTFQLPKSSTIYVKSTEDVPDKTTIRYVSPDGSTYDCESDNVILRRMTLNQIIDERLLPYLPFYMTRYGKELAHAGNLEKFKITL